MGPGEERGLLSFVGGLPIIKDGIWYYFVIKQISAIVSVKQSTEKEELTANQDLSKFLLWPV